MLIRSTPHACFVILENGLTLEVFYDETLSGLGTSPATSSAAEHSARSLPTASQGVWLIGESVLSEISAGQA